MTQHRIGEKSFMPYTKLLASYSKPSYSTSILCIGAATQAGSRYSVRHAHRTRKASIPALLTSSPRNPKGQFKRKSFPIALP